MNRVQAALRLTKEAKSLGNYDSNVIGMAAEIIAEEDLGLKKSPRGKKAVDGHIFLNEEKLSVQVKGWSCSRVKTYQGNTFFRIKNVDATDLLVVILIYSEKIDYEILYFGKLNGVGKLEKGEVSRTVKLSSLKNKTQINEILNKINSDVFTEATNSSKKLKLRKINEDRQMDISQIIKRAIKASQVKPDGSLTTPRSFGVYRLKNPKATRKFRLGNHPIRMKELQREFGPCELVYLFRSRDDAETVAKSFNSI